MMLRVPQVLSPEQVRQCRQLLEAADWSDGRATAGHLAAKVKDNQQLGDDQPAARQVGDLILQALGQHPLFMSAALPLKVLPPRFNRYQGGGQYGAHVDAAIFSVPSASVAQRSRNPTTSRPSWSIIAS